ncbi:MAG: UbiA family prenyltransferase [Candidatus Thermoplasmatota archaeon]|nr:UbiA family prenyltransferase [Candidatus Thermoplasmatota archaeon]
MKKFKAVWELMRLEHGVMIAIAVLIGSLIAARTFPAFDKFILTFFTVLFLEASTFALNDYYDIEIDKKNKRVDRPLVRGDISKNTALYLFSILFPLGIACSYFVNLTCFVIALVTALFAIFYDVVLKKIKLLGNFFIAYTMAIPFIFGAVSVLTETSFAIDLSPAIFIIALIAFLTGAGREIMKDVMDFEGDKEEGVRSFPKYIGIRKSNMISAFLYIIAIALSFLPFFMSYYDVYYQNYYYLLIVSVTDIMLLATSLQLLFKKDINMKIHRKSTLIAIFVGLIAFLLGAFVG